MGPETQSLVARVRLVGFVAFLMLVTLGAARPAAAQAGCTEVMGPASASPAQLAAWFATTGRQPKLDVSVADLATMFIEEGAREGVRGDMAFAQAIVETGYFGFSPSVPPEMHNYSGIGATGGGVKGVGFPDARTGVRAQIQHLRAYADPSLRSAADLKAPLVDPRFRYLVPNARPVPCWEQFGSGVWAADPSGYGPRILSVHQRIAATPAPAPAVAPVVAPAPEAVAPTAQAVAPTDVAAAPLVVEGGIVATHVVEAPAFASEGPSLEVQETLTTRSAVASRDQAGGAVGAMAAIIVGGALLTICVTLWWHGRRFTSSA